MGVPGCYLVAIHWPEETAAAGGQEAPAAGGKQQQQQQQQQAAAARENQQQEQQQQKEAAAAGGQEAAAAGHRHQQGAEATARAGTGTIGADAATAVIRSSAATSRTENGDKSRIPCGSPNAEPAGFGEGVAMCLLSLFVCSVAL